jgi:prephenate dehydrogenase
VKRKIAIIGGAGKMGRWFTNYFANNEENEVFVYDKKRPYVKKLKSVTYCSSLRQCVRDADYVLVTVSTDNIMSVIRESGLFMKPGSALLEISSIKKNIVKSLRAVPKFIIPISIHPMFGPGAKRLEDTKILIIPVREANEEKRKLSSIMDDAQILVIENARRHDKLMAVILGLVYFINLVLASAISTESMDKLNKYSGTTFTLQSILLHSILIDEPSLINSILMDNYELRSYLKNFREEINKFFMLIDSRNRIALEREVRKLKRHYGRNNEINLSYERMYSLVSKIVKKKGSKI